jgi:hypothetical protein
MSEEEFRISPRLLSQFPRLVRYFSSGSIIVLVVCNLIIRLVNEYFVDLTYLPLLSSHVEHLPWAFFLVR